MIPPTLASSQIRYHEEHAAETTEAAAAAAGFGDGSLYLVGIVLLVAMTGVAWYPKNDR